MAKRIIISVLLIILFLAAVTVAAVYLFQTNVNSAAPAVEETASASELGMPDSAIAGETAAASTQEEGSASVPEEGESFGVVVEPDHTVTEPTVTISSTRILEATDFVKEMTLEEKICQMLFVTQETLTGYNRVTKSGDATRSAFEKYPVGGIIYFATNLVSVDQTTEMIQNIQTFSKDRLGIGLFIGVDEEGGSVARLADNLGTTVVDNMAAYGAMNDPSKAYEVGTTIATDMKSLGFNVDFAPVADVLTNPDNSTIGTRSFGSEADLVSDYVAQEVQAFIDNAVICSPKHFPGQGSTGSDTHNGFAATDISEEELKNVHLKPFQAAIEAGAPMIMVGHMTLTSIDADNPASLSSAVITDILRKDMQYKGIVITDAMNMGAITSKYTSGEAAVQAIQAGCDMILCTSNINNVINAVLQAIEEGKLTEERIDESAIRIIAAKLQYGIE